MSRHLRPGLAVVLAALTGGCAERFFFYPDQREYTTPLAEGVRAEEVVLPGPDGVELHGWWLPAQGKAHGTVLHVHGNAANISNHLPLIAWLPAAGFNVLTFDYRGYGRSNGKPSIQGVVDDTRAALAWLRRHPGIDGDRLAVIGQSLGGATAVRAVAADPQGVRLLVLDSAFSSYRGIARESARSMGPVGWLAPAFIPTLPTNEHDPVHAAARLTMPLLVLHGSRDVVIPQHHGRALWAAAKDPKRWLPIDGGEHIDALMREDVRAQVREAMLAALQ
jgi:fermentation-respiration switch protein FrsA (DUF1100 family)